MHIHRIRAFAFIGIALLCFTPAHADSTDTLMAGLLNLMKGLVGRCDQLTPNYAAEFNALYTEVQPRVLDPMGITEALMAEADNIPELHTALLLKKFDKLDEATKRNTCERHLRDLRQLLEMAQEEPVDGESR